jgi:acyl dehydratase
MQCNMERETMREPVYFEDFPVGLVMASGSTVVTQEDAVGFAQLYDPQAQHIDTEGAKATEFGRLIVSGWQTAAITMRLKLDTMLSRIATGFLGMGLEQVRWPHPVFPGDTLRSKITVLSARPSNSRPEKGVVEYRVETFNQDDVLVLHMVIAVLIPRRPA